MIDSKNNNADDLSKVYLHSSIASRLTDISELLVEWYSLQEHSLSDFLHSENLDMHITPEQFEQLALRKLYLSNAMVVLIHKKQPFHISLQRLYLLNNIIKRQYPSSKLQTDDVEILNQVLHFIIVVTSRHRKSR